MIWRLLDGEPLPEEVCTPEDCQHEHHPSHSHLDLGATWGYGDLGCEPNALMVVAHPDDEALFGAGLMLHYPTWYWTVVCMTGDSYERHAEFGHAANLYREAGVNLVLAKALALPDRPLVAGDYVRWLDALRSRGLVPDVVFTHGMRGEYGHQHHEATHYAVHALYGSAAVFDFLNPGTPAEPQLLKGGANGVPVTDVKRSIFETAYVSQASELQRVMPGMVDRQMRGPELYTR